MSSSKTALLRVAHPKVRTSIIMVLALIMADRGISDAQTADEGQILELPLSIQNHTAGTVICQGSIAHWFSLDMPSIPAGASGQMIVHFDRHSGTLSIPGPTGELMAIETLWCGWQGRAWETRSQLAIDRSRFEASEHRQYHCRRDGAGLRCRVDTAH